ncbi:hypothetical protein GF380_01485 [Candidatus Uhrbacteria bacterium]|nr:hypothetical protein [Candidatus Uhrbacteria bacterium]
MASTSESILVDLRDRLTLCHSEIAGITQSVKEFVHMPLHIGRPPLITHSIAAFDFPVVKTRSFEGTVTLNAHLYVTPLEIDRDDSDGSQGLQQVTTFINRIVDYHHKNERFATSTLGPLENIIEPVSFSGRRFDGRDSENNMWVAFLFQFVVTVIGYKSDA